jgi:hypothetical protein
VTVVIDRVSTGFTPVILVVIGHIVVKGIQ